MANVTSMTGVERALCALNFQETDRVPLLGGFCPHAEFLAEASGMDFWANPRKAALEAYKHVGADMIPQLVLPASPEEFRTGDPRPAYDNRKRYKSPEDVVSYVEGLPSPDDTRKNYDFEAAYKQYVTAMKNTQEEVGDSILRLGGYGQCGFMQYSQFGYENFFIALIQSRDRMKKIFALSGEQGRLYNEVIAKAIPAENLPPFVYGGQDICDNLGPMVSVELLDELYFPNLKYAIEPLVDAGIKIIWHCDGNVNPLIDRLTDMGIAGFQGFQEETGVSLADLTQKKTTFGHKPILWGSISVTTTLPFGTVEDVKKDVERCIDIAAPGGGFFIAPTSSALMEVPKENLFAMYEHTKVYGKGKY